MRNIATAASNGIAAAAPRTPKNATACAEILFPLSPSDHRFYLNARLCERAGALDEQAENLVERHWSTCPSLAPCPLAQRHLLPGRSLFAVSQPLS